MPHASISVALPIPFMALAAPFVKFMKLFS
jgi:hypothetical protein